MTTQVYFFSGQTLALNFNITSSAPRKLHLHPRVFQINAGTNLLTLKTIINYTILILTNVNYFSANYYFPQIIKNESLLEWSSQTLEDVFQPRNFFSKQLLTSVSTNDVMSHVSYFLGYQTSVIYPWTACSVVLHL